MLPPTDLLFIPQMIYKYGYPRSNKTDRRKGNNSDSSTLETTNPTWADQGLNPVLRGERPVTNSLSYGTAYSINQQILVM
jgi:hypothetical protein